MKREAGLITVADPSVDRPVVELPTVQCVHCGCHFPLKPPKPVITPLTQLEAEFIEEQGRKVRGWCPRCQGYVCGPECAACVPSEQLLENIEQGRPLDYYPTQIGWTPSLEQGGSILVTTG